MSLESSPYHLTYWLFLHKMLRACPWDTPMSGSIPGCLNSIGEEVARPDERRAMQDPEPFIACSR